MFSTIFKEPTIMTYDQDFSISAVKSYKFSENLFFIPLLENEFAQAAFDYPVLITKTEEGIFPIALLSLRKDENLFVNGHGVWEKEFYIPSFLKTYPFIVTKPQRNKETRIMYDGSYKGINKNEPDAIEIIKDGTLTDSGKKVLTRLQNHYENFERTKQVFDVIDRMNLLKETEIKMVVKDSNINHLLTGLYQVDSDKLNKLDDESLLKLAKSGILSLISFHLASLNNVQKLTSRL